MDIRTSYLEYLRCSECKAKYRADGIHTTCPACQSPLLAQYDLEAARQQVDRDRIQQRKPGMWRWHEILPVFNPIHQISLGEGDTSLLHLPRLGELIGLPHLFAKDESSNPTGTFKARGLSAAVSKAKELGIEKIIIPTAGNAGGALAAYAARAGLKACIIMPMDTPQANIEESRIAGAEIIMVNGLINEAASLAVEKADTEGWFDLSTFKEPYRVEGKKIMGYELAEAFKWRLPDVIIYPTGGGTGLVGMCKAFDEMETLGWLENTKRPRMVAVQANGCAPVVRAFQMNKPNCDLWMDAHTIASGLRVPKSYADRLILRDLVKSDGTAVAVSDKDILESQKILAMNEGIFAAPEGAATLAGLKILIDKGWLGTEDQIVLFNTGSGLKYLDYHL